MNFIYVGETRYDGHNMSVVFLCDHIKEVKGRVEKALDADAADNLLGHMFSLEYLEKGGVVWGLRETPSVRTALSTVPKAGPQRHQ